MYVFRSVRTWLTLLFLALVGLASGVSWLYAVPTLKSKLVGQKLQDLAANSELVFKAIVPTIGRDNEKGTFKFDADKMSSNAYRVDQQIGARIAVFTPSDFRLIADSRFGPPLRPMDFPVLRETRKSGLGSVRLVSLGKSDFASVAVPIVPVDETGKRLGLAAIGLIVAPLRDVYSAVALVERRILLATGLALGVTLFVSFVVSYFIARRLKRIERSAEAIAAGDLDATVKVRTRDEIGQLAASFNTMGARLRSAFSIIEREKKSAETILNTLSEGVIGVSADGHVLSANPMAAKMLGRRLSLGAVLSETFPEEVRLMWMDVHQSGTEEPVVFELRGRTLEAYAFPVGAGTDLDSIVVLRDVTQQERLERARRDFVANASHEFKTPLFSLSGFLELLDEEGIEGEERAEFLRLMKEQVERLQALSLSLLDLSQVDAGAVRLHPEPVDVAQLTRSVLSEFSTRAAERDLDVSVHLPAAPVEVVCDDDRLAQVLRALLDNAVKFTSGGGHIQVSLATAGREVELVVSDNGMGIPGTELPKIFDRFYRGSLSRASKTGTGLGLSIARDLTQLMGGRLTASSRLGKGSQFCVTLPLNDSGPEPDEKHPSGPSAAVVAVD